MTKIINNKKYSTQTATFIGEVGYGYYGDLAWWNEALYIKRTGEFFIHGEGGPMSSYCKKVGPNEWGGSEKIIPLDKDDAREWAEKHLDYETFVEYFGDVEE